jgi:two-component system chemotaxis response regulator CheY
MKFLLADDDAISRMAVVDLLENLKKAEIEQVTDGMMAQQFLMNTNEPYLCIFDVRMPGLNGLELLRWMRACPEFLGWPVMLITSQNDMGTVQEAARLRVDGYVIKPAGMESVQRITQTVEKFTTQLLDRPNQTCAKLNITASRYSQYIASLAQQIQTLVRDWDSQDPNTLNCSIDACKTASTTLGCQQLQLVLAEAAKKPDPRMRRAIAMSMQGVLTQYRRYAAKA